MNANFENWDDVAEAVKEGRISYKQARAVWRCQFRPITALEVCRILQELSVAAAARKCGVHRSTYQKWEDTGKWPKGTMQKMDPRCRDE